MKTQTNPLRIELGRTKLITSHEGEDITFLDPAYGPDNYVNLAGKIAEAELEQPTMGKIASLVHSAHKNPDEKYSRDVIKMTQIGLLAFNGILYLPDEKLIYIKDRPEIDNGKVMMDKEDLENRVRKSDPGVRVVPFDSFGPNLAKNKFVQALVDGEEGAEKLAEIARNYRNNPFLSLLNYKNIKEQKIAVAALRTDWSGGRALGICGYDNDEGIGYAYSLQRKEKRQIKFEV